LGCTWYEAAEYAGRIDICDIYAFQKPKDVNKSVLVLNVNPVAPTYADAILKWGSGIGF
jgi:hypothetical protein